MSNTTKRIARYVVVILLMGAWFYLWEVKADAASTSVSTSTSARSVTKHCNIPWAVANSGYNIVAYCKKQNKSDGKIDPTLKFIYKCGGAAVIATWFVRSGRLPVAMSALSACAWGSLFEDHPKVKHAAIRRHTYYRSYGSPAGPRAV